MRKVTDSIRVMVNARGLQLECARFLHDTLLVSVLIDGRETMIWKEKERFRIKMYKLTTL